MGIRCFVAVWLPGELKAGIGLKTERLRKIDADVRWVPPENLHLTLKFLGNTPEELLPEIRTRLAKAAGSFSGFTAAFSGLGVFPGTKRPRVVWIGVREGAEALRGLQESVENSILDLGFEPEQRSFSPHLTLGRLRSQRGRDALIRELDAIGKTEFGLMEVRGVCLFRSDLSPKGAKYTKLHDLEFPGCCMN
jgi:2'-5' RNA ligase